jgi:hypothetical protein
MIHGDPFLGNVSPNGSETCTGVSTWNLYICECYENPLAENGTRWTFFHNKISLFIQGRFYELGYFLRFMLSICIKVYNYITSGFG